MSFISVLFALLLEQTRPLATGNWVHAAMRAWVRWSARTFDTGRAAHVWLALLVAVLVPALAVLGVYWLLLLYAGWWLALLWSALVLYASLGFRQFSSHFTQIRDALAGGDDARALAVLVRWQRITPHELPRQAIVARVIEFSVLAAHRHVFGVLAWFSVLAAFGLGPAGAVVYRMAEFVVRYWHFKSQADYLPISPALQGHASALWELLDWLPARATATGFAVMGNFEEAVDGWRRYASLPDADNDGLVLAAAAGAVNIALPAAGRGLERSLLGAEDLSDGGRVVPDVAHLAILVGLVWRTVVMWLVLLALLTLARLLG